MKTGMASPGMQRYALGSNRRGFAGRALLAPAHLQLRKDGRRMKPRFAMFVWAPVPL